MNALLALGGAFASLWVLKHVADRADGLWLASIVMIIFVALLFSAVQEIGEQFKDSPRPRLRASLKRRRR